MISDPRHRVQFRQLWIDKVRDTLGKTSLPNDITLTLKLRMLALRSGSSIERLMRLPPEQLTMEFNTYDLMAPLPIVACRAIKARGFPERELTLSNDWPACQAIVGAALNWCTFDILCSPETHVMLLDDRTAKAVAASSNSAATAAELQQLPHNPCLIEFYRPIEIGENVKRGIRLRAIGFGAVRDAAVPAAAACFYLDYWQTDSHSGARWPATIGIWFGGFNVTTADNAARVQVGFEADSVVETGIMEVCQRVARNLWDFVTSRSIRYEQVTRKPVRQTAPGERQQTQGLQSELDRGVTLLYLSRDCKTSAEAPDHVHPSQSGYRIEVPGTFHELVYCASCGDLHRHDLLGQACRKCSQVVGPRANVSVVKIWHSPYIRGPEDAPLKDVVRDVHRRKPPR